MCLKTYVNIQFGTEEKFVLSAFIRMRHSSVILAGGEVRKQKIMERKFQTKERDS